MGIFRPTKITGDIVIYSKWCVSCDYPDLYRSAIEFATNTKLKLQIIRTVYRPADHEKAIELWSSRRSVPKRETAGQAADYPPFVVYNEVISLKEFVKMIKDSKNKMVQPGEVKHDMQRLPKTKRSKRKHSSIRKVSKTSTSNEKEEK